jgi:hypothetical protein
VFSIRIQGPTTRANRLQPTHTSGTDLGTHLAVTQTKGGANGDNPGSADPQVGRPHSEVVRAHLPRVVSSVDPKRISVVLGVFSRSDRAYK